MAKPLILIIEDDATIVALYEFVITTIPGLTHEVYMTGRAALERVQQPPEAKVIILDLHLPEVEGHEILAAARKTTRSKVIVISADASALSEVAQTADRVYVKPMQIAELQAYLREQTQEAR